jgi:hypothetical protein
VKSALLLLSLLIIGCDSRQSSPAPSPQKSAPTAVDARAAVAPAIVDAQTMNAPTFDAGPSVPADPAREQQAAKELGDLADQFCACKDMQCVEKLEANVEAIQKKYDDIKNSKVVATAAGEFEAKATKCMHGLREATGTASPMVLAAEKATDEICACTDKNCLKTAIEHMQATTKPYEGLKGTKVDEDRLLAASQRMAACINKIEGP